MSSSPKTNNNSDYNYNSDYNSKYYKNVLINNIKNNKLLEVKNYLQGGYGIELEKIIKNGKNIFEISCMRGLLEMSQLIMNSVSSQGKKTLCTYNALFFACKSNNIKLVNYVLDIVPYKYIDSNVKQMLDIFFCILDANNIEMLHAMVEHPNFWVVYDNRIKSKYDEFALEECFIKAIRYNKSDFCILLNRYCIDIDVVHKYVVNRSFVHSKEFIQKVLDMKNFLTDNSGLFFKKSS